MHRRTLRRTQPRPHRRTALAVSAALLAAAPLLTACGGDAHPGAAAVVGGERIDVASLQAQVKDVRAAQAASPESAQLVAATGDLGRRKLNSMIFDRVVEKVARDNGVTASRAELQQTRTAFVRQSGGEDRLAAALLQEQGVAPGQIDGVVRRNVLLTKIAAKVGADDSPAGQKKLTDVFTAASKDLAIDVNPRFGAWDDAQIRLAAASTPWLRQISKAPEAVGTGA
ncbi:MULTISPECIES: SurA N-terminal domain-containing protein [unclassified Streptomyces]|uniref:SurA N-terminal domain-containing protein n=1 Tax=unclassified Streptomyces TaxID=2593676 RepID=UPI0006AE1604|nr:MULTISPECIES: SurA N-terminal domain-containing protein [unclassified Streptomyces]KOX18120.1 lipoprotein [Streptomyces sp. NRRL F-6491]KOX37713.1 lipoprotein [Streptomyces sp. NRRL F-6492]